MAAIRRYKKTQQNWQEDPSWWSNEESSPLPPKRARSHSPEQQQSSTPIRTEPSSSSSRLLNESHEPSSSWMLQRSSRQNVQTRSEPSGQTVHRHRHHHQKSKVDSRNGSDRVKGGSRVRSRSTTIKYTFSSSSSSNDDDEEEEDIIISRKRRRNGRRQQQRPDSDEEYKLASFSLSPFSKRSTRTTRQRANPAEVNKSFSKAMDWFECQVCSRAIYNRDGKSHLLSMHNIVLDQCQELLRDSESWNRYCLDKGGFKCLLCQFRGPDVDILSSHYIHVHDVKFVDAGGTANSDDDPMLPRTLDDLIAKMYKILFQRADEGERLPPTLCFTITHHLIDSFTRRNIMQRSK